MSGQNKPNPKTPIGQQRATSPNKGTNTGSTTVTPPDSQLGPNNSSPPNSSTQIPLTPLERSELVNKILADKRIEQAMQIPDSNTAGQVIKIYGNKFNTLKTQLFNAESNTYNLESDTYKVNEQSLTNNQFFNMLKADYAKFEQEIAGAPGVLPKGPIQTNTTTSLPLQNPPLGPGQTPKPSVWQGASPKSQLPKENLETALQSVKLRRTGGTNASTPSNQQGNSATPVTNRETTESIMTKINQNDKELLKINNILEKWMDVREKFLRDNNIEFSKYDDERETTLKKLMDYNDKKLSENEIRSLMKQRDDLFLKPTPDKAEMEKITNILIEKMGQDNKEEILENLEGRDEILIKIKQGLTKEAECKITLTDISGKNSKEYNKQQIDALQMQAETLAAENAALREKLRTAQDVTRQRTSASSESSNDEINVQADNPKKKIEESVIKEIAIKNDCSAKKTADGVYSLEFNTPPKVAMNVSQNAVTAPKGSDEKTLKRQCELFLDVLEKTGRGNLPLDEINISGPDKDKIKPLLKAAYEARQGNTLDITPRTPKPQPVEQNSTLSAHIGRGPG